VALKESEQKFKQMFEQAPLSYQSLDEKGNFTEVNQTWLKTLGYQSHEVIGKNFSEFLLPEMKNRFADKFPFFKTVGEILGVEYEMVKKDGSTILVSFHGKIGRDTNGIFERTHCVFHDITTQKVAEDSLMRELTINKAVADISKELLSEMYDIKKVSDVTLKYSKNITNSEFGFVSSIDKNTLENVGHTMTEMFGKQCTVKDQRITFPVGPDGKYDGLWGHALNTKEPFFSNQPDQHPSSKGLPEGHVPLKNYMAVPVLFGKTLSGLIALSNSDRDYTGRDLEAIGRLAEIFALALYRNQYELDKARTERQLQQMQKLEAVGSLAGGIAHDFNNILFPIVGMSEMLLEDLSPDSPEYESVEQIFKSARRGGELVEQILAFSRQSEHKMIPLRIQSILKEVLKLIRSTIPTNFKLSQNIRADCGMVNADPTQLHQIVMNLITNAYHAIEVSGDAMSVSLKETILYGDDWPTCQLSPGKYAKMTIDDNGPGIDPAYIEKIFEPYFTTKEKGKGTGLGLAVVHGIVKEHKGDIIVSSEVGKGTTFNVFFPLLNDTAKEVTPVKTIQYETGTERILLVDDETPVVQLEKKMLERLGYRATTCTSSLEALEAFRENPAAFDLVITDMTMPDMTGDQLGKELISIRPDIPIIICTGFSERLNKKRAEELGIKGYLMKPVVKSDMAQMVRMVLEDED